MTTTARILVVATATSAVVGFATVFAVLLADQPGDTIRYHLTTGHGVGSVLVIGAIVSLPISIPDGLAGGAVAARVASSESPHPGLVRWIGYGCLWGSAIGGIGTAAAFALPGLAGGEVVLPMLLLHLAAIGAVAGATVGAVVGAYCSRVVRLSRPQVI